MELFAIELDQLAGVVVEHGGPQSHAAILARSLAIPMVGQVPDFAALLQPGRRLLVDATAGNVILDPQPEDLASPDQTCPTAPPESPQTHAAVAGLPRVEVNINLLYEIARAMRLGAAGVGLYRSEFLFLARRTLPTEEEQVGFYRKLLVRLGGRPVTIRTFDLRPDKLASYSHLGPAAARALDWRLVLESAPLQQLFFDQLRAILRAATAGKVRILIPLVTRSELLDFVLQTLDKAREGLRREGLSFADDVPVGVMIETAAAAYMVPAWAGHVDFFALGTNDLAASALGLARDDPVSAQLADPLHPGVLRLVDEIVTAAHTARCRVSVCGEMAAEELGAIALAALQVDCLSVAVNQYTATLHALSQAMPANLSELRTQILLRRSAHEVRDLLAAHARLGTTPATV